VYKPVAQLKCYPSPQKAHLATRTIPTNNYTQKPHDASQDVILSNRLNSSAPAPCPPIDCRLYSITSGLTEDLFKSTF